MSTQATGSGGASRSPIERSLRIDEETKPQAYMRIFDSSDSADLNYWLELSFSAGIATLGLVLNSPAVVIGAMLISPLIGPIMAAGLALAVGDLYLGIKSLLKLIASVAAALLISAFLVWILPLHNVTTEILKRTQPNLLDLGVALLSGFAGSLLMFRRGGDGASALPGVAIAVALMPPLCTTGFGFGVGLNWSIISGAALLFLTNLAAIVASAFLVFLCVRMGAPEVRSSIERLRLERATDDWVYRLIKRAKLDALLGDVGKLRWRALMLVAILAALYVPLKKGLVQVRDEAIARAAVNEAVRTLAAPNDIVGQQVALGASGDPIRVSLLITAPVSPAKVRQAETTIVRRTGRLAEVSVRQIADQAEIARLRQGLEAPAPAPPPPPEDLETLRREVVARLEAAMREVWPPDLPLKGYELGFAPDAVIAHIRYESADPLAKTAEAILTRSLETRLGLASLRVAVENVSPNVQKPQKPKRASRR